MTNEEHIEQLKNIGCGGWNVTADAYESLKWAIEALNQHKEGHWIQKEGIYGVSFCDRCDFELTINDTNFCPNCGAKMKGGD